ncbi:MAG: response regulator transcription factor [Cyclobacteriaceae bacterium]
MKRVLLIEDDLHIKELLEIHLNDLDCKLTVRMNGTEGLKIALTENFDLMVLDIMLPGTDGLEICRQVRAEKISTPILMLTARSEEIDKILGLETGADDYLTKPFSVREFIARVKAIFRRVDLLSPAVSGKQEVLYFGRLTIDKEMRKVSVDDQRIELTPKEFDLLALLATSPGRSYSREQLLSIIWGYEFSGYEHTVNSHINRLRAKIEPDMNNPTFIMTTWGVGYRFNDEIATS